MPLMQRHIDIYRHKVIMGIHNRMRREKDGKESKLGETTLSNDQRSHDFSSNDLEINQEIPIDNPS